MSETANCKLYLTDGSSESFLDWREKMNGKNNSNMQKIDDAIGMKAEKSVSVTSTLWAVAWMGDNAPFTQDISVEGITAEQNGTISVPFTATEEQKNAAENAALDIADQIDGILTISAQYKPAQDIPVVLILLG